MSEGILILVIVTLTRQDLSKRHQGGLETIVPPVLHVLQVLHSATKQGSAFLGLGGKWKSGKVKAAERSA